MPEEEAGPGPDPEVSSEAVAGDAEEAAGPSNDLNNNADKLAPAAVELGKWTGSQDIEYAYYGTDTIG